MQFVASDYNGDYYVIGQQGEIEEKLRHRTVYIAQSDAALFTLGNVADISTVAAQTMLLNTIRLNYWALRDITLDEQHRCSDSEAQRIAYLRTHALVIGLGDPAQNIRAHHVRYSDIEIVADNYQFRITGATTGRGVAADTRMGRNDDITTYNDAAEVAWRDSIRSKVTNLICTVAFFMRTRGHHWMPDFEERYCRIWRNSLYDEDTVGIPWEKVAHHAYHFIYPDTLDVYWLTAAGLMRCSGALIKRIDSAPAGVAAVGAISAGANDLVICFPKIKALIPEAFAELTRCEGVLRNNRWAGSINRRFYNGPSLTPNEGLLGSLAAVIMGAIESTASAAALRNSAALRRVAANAPITGALIASMIAKAATDDRMIEALFEDSEEAD